MTQVTIDEAAAHLRELVESARNGEDIVLTDGDKPAVHLVRVNVAEPIERPRPRFGSAKGWLVMADDFDAPLDDFREYME